MPEYSLFEKALLVPIAHHGGLLAAQGPHGTIQGRAHQPDVRMLPRGPTHPSSNPLGDLDYRKNGGFSYVFPTTALATLTPVLTAPHRHGPQ